MNFMAANNDACLKQILYCDNKANFHKDMKGQEKESFVPKRASNGAK